jgi:flagella basal body P-ring formation protein FlgA
MHTIICIGAKMNLLNYTSKEMFSSTELIRKSKTIFDKINKKEIEKAIILRDGKPSFMLLDFETYEALMGEYISLKEKRVKNQVVKKAIPDVIKTDEKVAEKIEAIKIDTPIIKEEDLNTIDLELNDADLEDALAQIEKLDIGIKNTDLSKEESLKEFWD